MTLHLCRGQRLARALREQLASAALQDGLAAWASPSVFTLEQFFAAIWQRVLSFSDQRRLLSEVQSGQLFRDCVRGVVDARYADAASRRANAMFRSYRRAADWQLTDAELMRHAHSVDQQIFAGVVRDYRARLADNNWLDSAVLAAELTALNWHETEYAGCSVQLHGFISKTPLERALFAALEQAGCSITDGTTPAIPASAALQLQLCDDDQQALIHAGRWAAGRLTDEPTVRLAIVVPDLASDAEGVAARVADGLSPGWQLTGGAADWHVSFGRSLADYPLISVVLDTLKTLGEPLDFAAYSRLLRAPQLYARSALAPLAELELRLRTAPERRYRLSELCERLPENSEAHKALQTLVAIESELAGFREINTPRHWAAELARLIERLLAGRAVALDSEEYQLQNALRALLNDLASLAPVTPRLSGQDALAMLASLAANRVFQVENSGARVDVLGPLEVVGQHYDALWFARLDDQHWPPTVHADAFIGQRLQAERGMPGADVAIDAAFAERLFAAVLATARDCTASSASKIGDVPARPAAMALAAAGEPSSANIAAIDVVRFAVPGAVPAPRICSESAVPLAVDERVRGGAGLLATALESPFLAFVGYRLGAAPLPPAVRGIGSLARGVALHRAAERLRKRPDGSDPAVWRREAAAESLQPLRGHRDRLLHRLLDEEEIRTERILKALDDFDAARPAYRVAAVEAPVDFRAGAITLPLRIDRLDRVGDDWVLIDYKTGQSLRGGVSRSTGLPSELQLAIYALALRQRDPNYQFATLCVVRLHSRGVVAAGLRSGEPIVPGRTISIPDLDAELNRWDDAIRAAAAAIECGDLVLGGNELASADAAPYRPLAGIDADLESSS